MTQRPRSPARTLELRASTVLIGCAAIHAFLLAGTWLFSRYYRDPSVDWVRYGLVQLNLASENVLASWYGSILLLAIACVACACFLADRARAAERRPQPWAPLLFTAGFSSGLATLPLHVGGRSSWPFAAQA